MTEETAAPPSRRKPLRVVVTIGSESTGWELLAPGYEKGRNPVVGNCEFFLNPAEPVDADYWIVFANARPRDMMRCARDNTLFIAGEPEEKKVYPKAFYRQFHRVVDTHTGSEHARLILHAPCMSWHIGYDHRNHRFDIGHRELSAMDLPAEAEDKVSVVCSDAAFTAGQRERLRFLERLREILGERLVHFGRGFRPVDDKLDAIRSYRFHLVMENCRVPHYWTEKLSDAYLGGSFPFYVGCTNIGDYFPSETMEILDIRDPDEAARRITALLEKPRDAAERAAIAEGRRLALDVYNPWVAWAKWAEQFHDPAAVPENLVIRSHKAFRPFPRGLLFRLRG